MTERLTDEERNATVSFCVTCFADSLDGSWGSGVLDGGHCLNCGAGGGTVEMKRWQVEEIRRNASWVGRRYYPSSEDRELAQERLSLLALVPKFVGRSAKQDTKHPQTWWVTQRTPTGHPLETRSVSQAFTANSADEALDFSRLSSLPYVSPSAFGDADDAATASGARDGGGPP